MPETENEGFIGGFYTKLENGFFKILDFFETRGIPVYNYVEFLENKGIPVFPFTVGVIAIIIIALWFFLLSIPGSVFLTVNFLDDAKHSLNDVSLSIIGVSDGSVYYSSKTDSATRIELKGISIGTKVKLSAVKDGFESSEEELLINGFEVSKTLELARKIGILTARIKLIDAETGQLIKDATITAEFEGKTIPGIQDSNGFYCFIGIPASTPVKISIKADGYGISEKLLSFDSENPNSINLVPDAEGRIGNTNITFRVFDAETNQLIDRALIKVFEKDSGIELTSDIALQGELLVQLPKGKIIRWTASKEGYASFDSSEIQEFLTLRKEEENITIKLQKGGKTLNISVIDKENNTVLSEALITLFNSQGEKLDAKITEFGGFVEFKDLNVENEYYVSAVKEGYLPKGMRISLKQTSSFQLSLERQIAGLTANVSIFVIDNKENPVPGASLKFFEQTQNDKIPLGFPEAKTDISGFFGTAFKAGTRLFIEAVKDSAIGDANALLEASSMNRIEIQIIAPSNIVEFFFQDTFGNPINKGHALIKSVSGSILFDGNIENASIVFDTLGNKTVNLLVELPDGTIFEKSIKITEARQTIIIGVKENNGIAPEIKLLELENANGEIVEGLSRGQEGFLVFEIAWPDFNDFKAGVHVRVGSDGIKNAESQDIAILGFNANAQSSFLGRTFNPKPIPGNASIDYSNNGELGKANKFVELYFENPKGTQIIKVRVKLSDTAALKQEVHYRAWSIIENNYYRNPIDAVIGLQEYSKQKLGLYAETINEEINVFESEKTSCSKEVCASFIFLDSGFNVFETKDFKAVKDKVYALEIALSGKDTVNALINASTSKENPKIGFQASNIDAFAEMPDNNSFDSSIEVKDIIVEKNKETKVRIYFKTLKAGNASISVQITAGSTTISQNLPFNIFEEKNLIVEFIPKISQEMGKDFSVFLRAQDTNAPVENATIIFKNNAGNEISRTIGSASNGKNGKYKIKNTFNAGLLNIEITASGFKPLITSYLISQAGVLKMPESITINIPSKEKTAIMEFELKNNSNSEINNLSIEQFKPSNFNNAFNLENSQPSPMPPNSAQKIQLTASYTGNALAGQTELILKASGILGENIPVNAETKVILNYNQKLNPNCLEFYPQALQATLFFNALENTAGYNNFNNYASNAYASPYNNTFNPGYSMPSYNERFYGYSPYKTFGSSYSARQVPLTLKNNCIEELMLSGRAIPQGIPDNGLSIAIPDVTLQPGEQQTINISIENNLGRAFYSRKAVNYSLVFTAEQLQKSLPLTVNLLSIRFAIQAPDVLNISIIGKGQSAVPMFVRNIGNAAIENLKFELGGGYGEGVQLRIEPSMQIPILPPSKTVIPQPLVIATADVEKSKILRQFINIKGSIDGRELILKQVNVFVNVSAPSCLKVSPQEIEMIEEAIGQGAKTSELTISNYCLEDVRITDIEPKSIGNNALSFIGSSQTGIIPVNGKSKIQLRLSKIDEIDTTTPLVFYGALLKSGNRIQTDPVNLTVKLGKSAVGDLNSGPISVQAELPECEDITKKIIVKFPKIASNNDCSNGYCDAEQMAEFIAGKIAKKVSEVEQIIQAKNKNPEGLCGNPKACSFSELGVKPETFTTYFQNDLLSTELMRSKIENDNYSSIKGFSIDYFSGTETNALQLISGKGFGRKILIPQLKGCGKYKIRIDGAVDIIAGQIQSGRESIAVFLLEKTQTQECSAKVQNFQNFLPNDASLSVSSPLGSWLGVIDSVEGLEENGKEIAQQLFGKPERFSNISSNKLLLDKKSIPEGIAEITIVFNDYPTQPVIVNAFISQEKLAVEAQKKEALKEIARAINGLKNNLPAKGSCITADGKTLRITSAVESFGELSISPCIQTSSTSENSLKVSPEKETCCNFNVSGNLANQKIAVQLIQPENKFNGLQWSKTGLRLKGEKNIKQELETNLKSNNSKNTGKNYSAEFQLCTIGDKYFIQANNNTLTIKAFDKSKTNVEQKPTTSEVKLKACAIHPFDLVDDLTQKQEGTFYALVNWKGEPEKTTIGEIAQIMEKNEKLRSKLHGKHFFESQSGINALSSTAGQEEVGRIEAKGLAAYTIACVVSHGALDLLGAFLTLGGSLFGSITSIGFDCGIPAVMGVIDIGLNRFSHLQNPVLAGLNSVLNGFKELSFSALKKIGLAKEGDRERSALFGAGVAATIGEQGLRKLIPAIKEWLTESIENPKVMPKNPDKAIEALKEYQVLDSKVSGLKKKMKDALTLKGFDGRPDKIFNDIEELKIELLKTKESYSWDTVKIHQLEKNIKAFESAEKELSEASNALKAAAEKAGANIDDFVSSSKSEIEKIDKILKKGGLNAEKRKALEKAKNELKAQIDLFEDKFKSTVKKIKSASSGSSERSRLSKLITESSSAKVTSGVIESTSRSKLSRWSDWWKASKTAKGLRFFGNILNGILANYAGFLWYTKTVQNEPIKNHIIINCYENDESKCELVKGQPYKILISKDSNKLVWNISRFDDLSKIPEKAVWIEKCDDSSEKPLTAEGFFNESKTKTSESS